MLKYMLKVLCWRLTPKKKRGECPKRPPFDMVRTFTAVIIVFTVISAILTYYDNIKTYEGELSLNGFWMLVEQGEVDSVDIGYGQLVRVYLDDGRYMELLSPNYTEFRKELMEAGVSVRFVSGTYLSALITTLTSTLFIVILLVVCVVFLRTVVQTNQLKAVRAKTQNITFDDVRGMSDTKEEIRFAVEQLRHRYVLREMGARPVKGILFEGPPGTGKTLLAKAIAGEAGVPLISASGSDFIEMFVGVGAARIRRLWQQAEDSAPCVLFIDEIDAVGRQRGSNAQNMESNQTINALLQRMDGLGTRNDILVIGATNRKEDLDPALLRPGRFDRIIYVGPPKSQADREDICDLYLSKINVSNDVTVQKVAKLTAGMTGADIAQCLNDAVLLVARDARELAVAGNQDESNRVLNKPVSLAYIDRAITRHLLGGVATGHIAERDRKLAAIHEAGHAIVCLAIGIEVLKVSITPYTSGVGGITQTDSEETQFLTQEEVCNKICVILGGYAAEVEVNGTHTTGVENDLAKASEVAHKYVTCFGAGGLLNEYSLRNMVGYRGVSDSTLFQSEEILQREAERARNICKQYREKLNCLVERLLSETTILNLTSEFLSGADVVTVDS